MALVFDKLINRFFPGSNIDGKTGTDSSEVTVAN